MEDKDGKGVKCFSLIGLLIQIIRCEGKQETSSTDGQNSDNYV